jgi:lysyl-tRNA synthetase class 2
MTNAPTDGAEPWWSARRHTDRRPLLLARNAAKAALRGWFEQQGFTEVDPGALQRSPGNETHLHAFATRALSASGAEASPLYLHTSPEFAMKKLLAAGERKIFTFSPVYRNREDRSPLHAPEFTMLEFYRANEPYEALFQDCAGILTTAARAVGTGVARWRGLSADPLAPPQPMSVRDAFIQHAGMDLFTLADRDAFAQAARAADLRIGDDHSWSDIFAQVLVRLVEPKLGLGAPLVLHEYPMQEAALARRSPADPRVAERFELYLCGVELANGFGELTDPVEQRARFEADMDAKQKLYGERYPIDEDLLIALSSMPPASGCALGFDRLVMLLTGAAHIDDVLWSPPPR